VRSEPFELPVEGGALHGHRAGSGAPALLLHGGAAVPDYLDECASSLDGLFETFRYTQRGTPPSLASPPYTIEAHVADAIGVLDRFGLERAWAIGHSWGGHLALHLAVSRPERLLGVLCIDPLGADGSVFVEYTANLARHMSDDEIERIAAIEERRRRGEVTEAELVERFAIVWPHFFSEQRPLIPPPAHVGPQASIEVNASLSAHFAAGTLARGLPTVRLPALFVHGELDAMPAHATEATAALIPGARVGIVAGAGHYPWLEQPERFRLAVEHLLA
jgi:pimeloyl-ACP methyl ester carboxylesterase